MKHSSTVSTLLLLFITITTSSSFEQAEEYQKSKRYTDAIRCYEEIMRQEPYNLQALFNLGNCYLALGMGEKAITAFKMIASVIPDALPARHNLGYTQK